MKQRLTRKTFGPLNAHKTIFIIRRKDPNGGLFWLYITIAGLIRYALKHGYVPVVDLMTYPNFYIGGDQIGNVNAWEYYFQQPGGVSLEDAYKSKKTIVVEEPPVRYPFTRLILDDKHSREFKTWRRFVQKHITLQPSAEAYINSQYAKLIDPGDKVLGVLCRGTDYAALKPKGHCIQPEPDVVIEKAEEVMRAYHCNKLFLASEDGRIIQQFQEHFGDKLIMNDAHIYDYDGARYIGYMTCDRKNDKYLKGLEYLTAIVIVSRCSCMVGGATSGTIGALLLSKGFAYSYVWDLGVYQ